MFPKVPMSPIHRVPTVFSIVYDTLFYGREMEMEREHENGEKYVGK